MKSKNDNGGSSGEMNYFKIFVTNRQKDGHLYQQSQIKVDLQLESEVSQKLIFQFAKFVYVSFHSLLPVALAMNI